MSSEVPEEIQEEFLEAATTSHKSLSFVIGKYPDVKLETIKTKRDSSLIDLSARLGRFDCVALLVSSGL